MHVTYTVVNKSESNDMIRLCTWNCISDAELNEVFSSTHECPALLRAARHLIRCTLAFMRACLLPYTHKLVQGVSRAIPLSALRCSRCWHIHFSIQERYWLSTTPKKWSTLCLRLISSFFLRSNPRALLAWSIMSSFPIRSRRCTFVFMHVCMRV